MVVETSTVLISRTNITGFLTTDNGGAISTTNCDIITIVNSYFKDN